MEFGFKLIPRMVHCLIVVYKCYIFIIFIWYYFQEVRTVRLTLRKTKPAKQVKWSTETVDNEHLNRKKSKCKFFFFFSGWFYNAGYH